MPTVTEQAQLPADVDPQRCVVEVQLYQDDRTPLREAREASSGETVVGRRVVVLDGASAQSPAVGAWSLALPGTANLVPAGTVWGRTLSGPRVDPTLSYATVPTTGGPYQWQQILTDPPAAIDPSGLAAHAADADLHGGGQRLFHAERTTNFSTTSTTFVDVPSLTGTITVPDRPYVIDAAFPVVVGPVNDRFCEARLVFGSGPTVLCSDYVERVDNPAPGGVSGDVLRLTAPIPNGIHTPVAGTQVTYKVQIRSSNSDTTSEIFIAFGAQLGLAYIKGVTE